MPSIWSNTPSKNMYLPNSPSAMLVIPNPKSPGPLLERAELLCVVVGLIFSDIAHESRDSKTSEA